MVDLPQGPGRGGYFALHKSIGLTVFLLALIRVAWRLTHKPPPLPASMGQRRRELALGTHAVLYILMCLQPISGYLSSSFSGHKTSFFGLPLPSWGWKDAVLNDLFTDLHVASSVALVMFISMHIAGALLHAFSPGDGVLRRMLP